MRKDPAAGKDWRQKRVTKDEMVGWHHWLNGHEFEQAQGDSEGQGNLACFSLCGCKESGTTDWTTTKMWCRIEATSKISPFLSLPTLPLFLPFFQHLSLSLTSSVSLLLSSFLPYTFKHLALMSGSMSFLERRRWVIHSFAILKS